MGKSLSKIYIHSILGISCVFFYAFSQDENVSSQQIQYSTYPSQSVHQGSYESLDTVFGDKAYIPHLQKYLHKCIEMIGRQNIESARTLAEYIPEAILRMSKIKNQIDGYKDPISAMAMIKDLVFDILRDIDSIYDNFELYGFQSEFLRYIEYVVHDIFYPEEEPQKVFAQQILLKYFFALYENTESLSFSKNYQLLDAAVEILRMLLKYGRQDIYFSEVYQFLVNINTKNKNKDTVYAPAPMYLADAMRYKLPLDKAVPMGVLQNVFVNYQKDIESERVHKSYNERIKAEGLLDTYPIGYVAYDFLHDMKDCRILIIGRNGWNHVLYDQLVENNVVNRVSGTFNERIFVVCPFFNTINSDIASYEAVCSDWISILMDYRSRLLFSRDYVRIALVFAPLSLSYMPGVSNLAVALGESNFRLAVSFGSPDLTYSFLNTGQNEDEIIYEPYIQRSPKATLSGLPKYIYASDYLVEKYIINQPIQGDMGEYWALLNMPLMVYGIVNFAQPDDEAYDVFRNHRFLGVDVKEFTFPIQKIQAMARDYNFFTYTVLASDVRNDIPWMNFINYNIAPVPEYGALYGKYTGKAIGFEGEILTEKRK